MNPLFYSDFYKTSHFLMYPPGTEYVYSNATPRSTRINNVDRVVVFGIQYFLKEYLQKRFDTYFFYRNRDEVINEYKSVMDSSLGPNAFPLDHLSDLHDLGYLPIKIKALPEGSLCPLRVPYLTIVNTKKEFYWLTNFLESILSNVIWMPITSATLSFRLRQLCNQYAKETCDDVSHVPFMMHDFSMRGMSSLESSEVSGAAHLLSFVGTDTVPAIPWLEKYYGANSSKELVGTSVYASEHSIACMWSAIGDNIVDGEFEYYRNLITNVFPKGIVSLVADSYDYWNVFKTFLPNLKETIINRDGKVVIRGDSGDPVKIIIGDESATDPYIKEGSVECLWNIFGGTINSKGYKVLDPHIGYIYGDGMNYDRCLAIFDGLKKKGFAVPNTVSGIGSFTF